MHPLTAEYESLVENFDKKSNQTVQRNSMLRESVIVEDHFNVGEEVVVNGKTAKIDDIVRDEDGGELYSVKMEDGSVEEFKPSQIKKALAESDETSEDEEESDEVSDTQELAEKKECDKKEEKKEISKTKNSKDSKYMKDEKQSKTVKESLSSFDKIFQSIIKENFDEDEDQFDSDVEEFDADFESGDDATEDEGDEFGDDELEIEDEEIQDFDPVSAIAQIKDIISQLEAHYGIGEESLDDEMGEEEIEIGDEEIDDVEDLEGDDDFNLDSEQDELKLESSEVGEGAGGKSTDIKGKQKLDVAKDNTKNSVKKPSKTNDHRKELDKGKKTANFKHLKKGQPVKGFDKPKIDKK